MELGTTPKHHLLKNIMTKSLHGKKHGGWSELYRIYELSMIHQMIAYQSYSCKQKINHRAKLSL
jgi:hypothetical protein